MDFEAGRDMLRNKGKLTRMLILLDLVVGRDSSTTGIARSVEITPQGASDYLRAMEGEGLIKRSDRHYRASVKGVEWLNSTLLSVKDFVDRSMQGLDIIRSIDAVSDGPLKKGQKVNLYMKEGLLFAGREESPSWGIADRDSGDGEMASVSELSGVVKIDFQSVRLVTVPPARSGGAGSRLGSDRLRRYSEEILKTDPEKVVIAALDMESAAMLRRSSIRYQLEMVDASIIASYHDRGRPVIAFGTPF